MAVHRLADGIEPHRLTVWRLLSCIRVQLFQLPVQSCVDTLARTGAFSASRILVTDQKVQGR
jgi:hypothetical protein